MIAVELPNVLDLCMRLGIELVDSMLFKLSKGGSGDAKSLVKLQRHQLA